MSERMGEIEIAGFGRVYADQRPGHTTDLNNVALVIKRLAQMAKCVGIDPEILKISDFSLISDNGCRAIMPSICGERMLITLNIEGATVYGEKIDVLDLYVGVNGGPKTVVICGESGRWRSVLPEQVAFVSATDKRTDPPADPFEHP